MKGVDDSITLGVGNTSWDQELGQYYQDMTPGAVHLNNGVFAQLDEEGVPYRLGAKVRLYYPVMVIQFGLMSIDLHLKNDKSSEHVNHAKACMNWLESNKTEYKGAAVWRNLENTQYQLKEGWLCGMVQGQALSLYLRWYQLTKDAYWLSESERIYRSFNIDVSEGGFTLELERGKYWYEEYPTSEPSLVLNGYVYAIFGILDLYRVTKREELLVLWNNCVELIQTNLKKYDRWYWSAYDIKKGQLVSYYYQKNVHVPLMKILYELTRVEEFHFYAQKWEANLNNWIDRLVVQLMYRIQPRLN